MTDDLSGRVLKGYELRKRIGKGGFGAVYQAYQSAVGRDVAIKIILPQYANQPEFIRRFESEAQLVARLEHPFIVPLFDYWREPDGAYLVMRFLKGGSLSDALDEGPMDATRVSQLIDQIAAALTIAHRHGVVHRDIKPGNILLDEEGNAYLADFGIAKVTDEGDEEEDTISGSPAYMAPEQILSEPVTAQSDIYSLGVVVFELLTGRKPFDQLTASELIIKHLQESLPELETLIPDLPSGLNYVVQRATTKNAADRYPDALAFAADLRDVIGEEDTIDVFEDVTTTEVMNPYKGLRAFQEADAVDFFGREALINQLLSRLSEDTHFLAVIGPSGSGKSSVVKAGLLPALRGGALSGSENWFFAEMTPGPHPMEELEAALLSVATAPPPNLLDRLKQDGEGLAQVVNASLPPEEHMLLVIDQFEEVFTLVAHEEERTRFLHSLHTAATAADSRLWVIITLRADFYDKPLMYKDFANLMRQHTEVVVPLTPEELERAITGPAERVGLFVDPELLAAIINDVSQEPGTLPLLQYALTEVFERRDGRTLSLQAYHESGGALGALARRAEELFESLDSDRQTLVRQLFLRLVNLDEGSEDTRRRVGWAELTSFASDGPDLQAILDLFGKYRLLSFDRDPSTREPTVEIAHEALINEWKHLRNWIDSSRVDVRLQRRLASGAAEWRESGRETSFLLRGALLEQLEDWAATTDLALTEEERGYLAASIVERRSQQTREEARRRRQIAQERRARTRLQMLVAVLAIAAGVALGMTAFAFNQSQRSENKAATATIAQGTALLRVARAETQIARVENQKATSVAAQGDAARQLSTQTARLATVEVEYDNLLTESSVSHSLALAAKAAGRFTEGEENLALSLALAAVTMDEAPEEARQVLELVTGIDPGEAASMTLDELVAWTRSTFDVRELTCAEWEHFGVPSMCDIGQVAPTEAP